MGGIGNYRHGGRHMPEYGVWRTMISRCHNANYKDFDGYGSRGIVVCQRWRESFAAFREDMGPRPQTPPGKKRGFTIERKDNDGDYTPGNCVWASYVEQQNNRRGNRFLEYAGVRLTLAQWGARVGISPKRILARLTAQWSVERTLTTPVPHKL
jgi:hypothetical protein